SSRGSRDPGEAERTLSMRLRAAGSCRLTRGGTHRLVFADHRDEDVLDGGTAEADAARHDAQLREHAGDDGDGLRGASEADAQDATEVRDSLDVGQGAHGVRREDRAVALDLDDLEAAAVDDLLRRADADGLAAEDEGEPVAALGLVHVVR